MYVNACLGVLWHGIIGTQLRGFGISGIGKLSTFATWGYAVEEGGSSDADGVSEAIGIRVDCRAKKSRSTERA